MRVAIVCDTFFPNPTVSSIRVTEFCRALSNEGYKVDVFYRYYYPVKDGEVYREFGAGVRAECLSSAGSGLGSTSKQFLSSLKSLVRKIVGNVLVPDLTVKFWRKVSPRLLKAIEAADILITSSPPHAVHEIGIQFKQHFPDRQWIADFRDPYLIDSRFKPKGLGHIVRNQHRAYLNKVYENTNVILHAIPIEHRWARQAFPELREKFLLIKNGAPTLLRELVRQRSVQEQGKPETRQSVDSAAPVYSLATVGYCPTDEARQLCLAIKELNSSGKQVTLDIAGRVSDRLVTEFGNMDEIRFHGQVSHKDALNIVANADLNISLLDKSRSLSLGLSSKLFEYAYVQRPILSVNPTRSDRLFLRSMEGAKWLHAPSTAGISETIAELLVHNRPLSSYSRDRSSFSREFETIKFVSAINGLNSSNSLIE